jgi:hypothetical protein
MTTKHYQAFKQWKQTTVLLVTLLLLVLIGIHYTSYRMVGIYQKKLKSLSLGEESSHAEQGTLETSLKDIDDSSFYKIVEAFCEVMPHDVKIEKLEYKDNVCSAINFRSKDSTGLARMLDACAHHTLLKNLHLTKSEQQADSTIFTLL